MEGDWVRRDARTLLILHRLRLSLPCLFENSVHHVQQALFPLHISLFESAYDVLKHVLTLGITNRANSYPGQLDQCLLVLSRRFRKVLQDREGEDLVMIPTKDRKQATWTLLVRAFEKWHPSESHTFAQFFILFFDERSENDPVRAFLERFLRQFAFQ